MQLLMAKAKRLLSKYLTVAISRCAKFLLKTIFVAHISRGVVFWRSGKALRDKAEAQLTALQAEKLLRHVVLASAPRSNTRERALSLSLPGKGGTPSPSK
jgi:hypothetical protein